MSDLTSHKSDCTSRGARRGAATLVLILCLAVLGIVCGATYRAIAFDERLARHERQRAQAWWLAEAGLERAIAQLERDANYQGETWSIDASQLEGLGGATVNIQVRGDRSDGPQREVVAQAGYPVGAGAVRQTRTILLNSQTEGSN
jgi:type II secretory pathway component PulK